jgi:hypothetical protein
MSNKVGGTDMSGITWGTRVVFITVLLAILLSTYVFSSGLIIDSRMPSVTDAPYIYQTGSYEGALLWPENRILVKSATITASENGTVRLEASGYWYRQGIDWVYADEPFYMTKAFPDSKSMVRTFFATYK